MSLEFSRALFRSSAQVALSWTGFTDAGSGLATTNPYKLFSSTIDFPASCSGTPLFSSSQTSFTHSGLTNGTTYFYRLCATDNAGNRSEERRVGKERRAR